MVEGAGRRCFGVRRCRGVSQAGRDEVVQAWERGFVAEMDTTALGWAVQRTGAGREKAGEPVDPHAGIVFHARRGAWVEKGAADGDCVCDGRGNAARAGGDPEAGDPVLAKTPPEPVELVSRIFTRESAERIFAQCCKVGCRDQRSGGQRCRRSVLFRRRLTWVDSRECWEFWPCCWRRGWARPIADTSAGARLRGGWACR